MEDKNEIIKMERLLSKKKKERSTKINSGRFSLLAGFSLLFSVFISDKGEEGPLFFWSIVLIGYGVFVIYKHRTPFTESDYHEQENKNKAEKKVMLEKRAADEAIANEALSKEFASFSKKINVIDSNLNKLMSLDCPKPIEFKNNVFENEKLIVAKGSSESLHKFVKVSAFLDDLWNHLIISRQDVRDTVNPKQLEIDVAAKIKSEKNRSLEDITRSLQRKADGDFKDYSAKGILKSMDDFSKKANQVFPKEFAQVAYLEAMANSMLIFLLEDKQIYYFEILEAFDKLGALDSSWQKSVAKKMDSIESKLDSMIIGISNLNESINRLIEKNEDITKQLQSIDSSIATNNLLQAITAYQVYKINKNTKGLSS